VLESQPISVWLGSFSNVLSNTTHVGPVFDEDR